jgi:hypothetical protein
MTIVQVHHNYSGACSRNDSGRTLVQGRNDDSGPGTPGWLWSISQDDSDHPSNRQVHNDDSGPGTPGWLWSRSQDDSDHPGNRQVHKDDSGPGTPR